MEMVATGNTPQAKASKDEVFSVELQSQVGKTHFYLANIHNKLRLFRWSK